MASMPKRSTPVGALLFTFALAGCGDGTIVASPDPMLEVLTKDGVVLFTQNRVPDVTMDALFEGPVVQDAAGCLRLASADGATVVWPLGYTADVGGSSIEIRAADGALVGTVGEAFTSGGGEVEALTEAMGFTDADRHAAEVCPGRYWIASG